MATNYSKTLSDPNTSFTPVTVRKPADTSDERDAALTGLLAAGSKAAGKAYATAEGASMSGADSTLEEVNNQAELIDERISAALQEEQSTVGGPLSSQRVSEIKDAQLSAFSNNDRTLLALRDRGVISTTEARARRTMNLKRALSNPINSMFRKDFLNAAGDLTGGGTGAVDAMFQLTPEEKEAAAIQEAQQKATAEYEGAVTDRMTRTGKSREVVTTEMAQAEEDKRQVEKLNRLKNERALTGMESDELFARSRSGVSRGNAAKIAELNIAGGGKGLGAAQQAQLTQEIESQYQQLMMNLNGTGGLTGAYRDTEQARIEKWKAGQLAMVKAYDAAELDKNMLAEFDVAAQKIGWAHAGEIMALKAIDPKLFDVFLKSGGNLDQIMNQTLGGERGTQFVDAAKMIGDFSKLSQGGVIENKQAVATMLNSQAGLDYVSEAASAGPESKVSAQLKAVYADAPAESLKMFTSGIAQMSAAKDEGIRTEMDSAMQIARDKTAFNLKTKGGNGMITIRSEGHIGRNKRPKIMLDIPEGMQDHAEEIKQVFKVINKHPWSWEHVSDEYMDAADAANGYLRGEWEINMLLDGGDEQKGRDTRRGRRIKAEVPVQAEKLSSNEEEPRVADVAELKELIAMEEAGQAPTPEQEDRLVALLEQRIAIRDRKRSSSGVRAPAAEQMSQAVADAPKSNLAQETVDAESSDKAFASIAPKLFKFEGGFQNNPNDKGNFYKGKNIGTNMGISAAQYKNLFGEEPTVDKLKALTPEKVEAVYKEKYWEANQIDKMPPELQEMALNMFVMTSPKNVVKAIQRASGAKEDGIMGPQTLKAMRGVSKEEIWKEYHKYLKSLSSYKDFGPGWTNRYEELLNA